MDLSVVIPSKNEANNLKQLLPELMKFVRAENIVIVDDGSDDNTAELCEEMGVRTLRHSYSKGNGAAIKSGAKAVDTEWVLFMDADGQHPPSAIPDLIAQAGSGYDLIIGARSSAAQANVGRSLANRLYNKLASLVVGHKVLDLTSGLRLVKRKQFMEFIYLLPNGFSYPTTSTMAFFRAGYSVKFVPFLGAKRDGKSHLKPIKDGVRFLLIIFKIATLYSPLKIFFPISMLFFLTGCGYYGYTFFEFGRFTNMSALLFICSILIFIMGLISEQITTLQYKDVGR